MDSLTRTSALYLSTYGNYPIIDSFNVEIGHTAVSDFCNTFDVANLIKEPTCYKNPQKPYCIDLILTNQRHSFRNSCVIELNLSDFHRIIVTAIKITFQKLRQRVVNYRVYKHFDNENYRKDY